MEEFKEIINAIKESIIFVFSNFINNFLKIFEIKETFEFENLINALPKDWKLLAKILIILDKILNK